MRLLLFLWLVSTAGTTYGQQTDPVCNEQTKADTAPRCLPGQLIREDGTLILRGRINSVVLRELGSTLSMAEHGVKRLFLDSAGGNIDAVVVRSAGSPGEVVSVRRVHPAQRPAPVVRRRDDAHIVVGQSDETTVRQVEDDGPPEEVLVL